MTVSTATTGAEPLHVVLEILTELTADLDGPPVEPGSRLDGLGLESISIVYLIAEVQQEFGLGDALVHALRARAGARLPHLTVGEFSAIVTDTVADVRKAS